MHDFIALSLDSLEHVSGGAGGEQTQIDVGLNADRRRINIGVSGTRSQSDYAKCVTATARMPGATPADIRATCGLPPAQGR